MIEDNTSGNEGQQPASNEKALLPEGRAAEVRDPLELEKFRILLKSLISDLRPGGPTLSLELLVGYIDGVLDPDTKQQVGQNIVTWKAWYDAYWQMAGTLDNPE